ncbi:MAG: hypothetical protein BroJett011_18280 [Chloroflexota bacterium]|nr:MAG: hypothetical protein BroJett011_18280 [Chloroflexota bacterium]
MTLFTPDSPAGRAVRDLLHQHKEGLSVPQLRRELRSFRLSEANILEILNHPDFDGPDPQGRYTLRRLRQAEQVLLKPAPQASKRPRATVPPTLAHPPFVQRDGSQTRPIANDYIVFDLETTGINPASAHILQLSALKIIAGVPDPRHPIFNRYVDPGYIRLPYTLQLKLNLTRDSTGRLVLPSAAPLPEVLEDFRGWAGDLPLIAHNARFDYSFLNAAFQTHLGLAIESGRLLDTMEMACLAYPLLPSHKLEDLAAHLGIRQGTPLGQEIEALAQASHTDFSWDKFHNAIVDVLVLAVVFRELQQRLQDQLQPLAGWVGHSLPDLARWLGWEPETGSTGVLPAPYTLLNLGRSHSVLPLAADHPARRFSTETVQTYFHQLLAAKNYPERLSQTEMVRHVAEAFQQDHFLIIEAPTGTGKTYAYLVPAILRARSVGQPVVISTNTRNLQDQLMDDLENLQQNLGITFNVQPIKGMENYLCLERLDLLIEELAQSGEAEDTEQRLGLLHLLSWLSVTQTGALDELSYWFQATFPSFQMLRREVQVEWERCNQATCPGSSGCFFRRAYEQAARADIVVVNHALLLAKKWQHVLRFEHLVVDEAHNLEDVATNVLTRQVSLDTLAYVLGRLHDPRTGRGLLVRLRAHLVSDAEGQRLLSANFQEVAHASHLVGEFGGHLRNYLKARKAKIHQKYGAKLALQANPRKETPRLWQPVEEAKRSLLNSLGPLYETLNRLRAYLVDHPLPQKFHDPTLREMDYLLNRLDIHLPDSEPALLTDILRVGYDSRVMVNWLEVEAESEDNGSNQPVYWALKSAPVRVDRFLQRQLYHLPPPEATPDEGADQTIHSTEDPIRRASIIFTSATLRTTRDDNFGFFIERLGLVDFLTNSGAIALPPTLLYERAIFGIPRYLRYDARPQDISKFAEETARELACFFEFTDGKGLALYTARQRMNEAYHLLEPRLGDLSIPVDYQGEERSRRALAEEFRARIESVLLGLRSFWEGFDAPGETLTYVIMEKLPFPLLTEPIIQARAAQISAQGGNEFFDYLLPLTFIHFKQGFGRLLRRETDLGAVLLMDKRVTRKSYYADMRAALPSPVFMDAATERDRRAFYERIAAHVNTLAEQIPDPAVRQAYQIDLEAKADFLANLSAGVLLDLERRLAALGVPDLISADQIELWMERVLQALREVFENITGFREKQAEIIRQILQGRDVLAVLPTGSGKSLTFQLPALLRQGTTLVFSPLKALMKDQVDQLHSRGITLADYIYSGQTADDQEVVFRKIRTGDTRLVYISPERIRDPRLKDALRHAKNIVQVVVDEAHCVHTWGQSFRPDFLHIPKILAAIRPRPETGQRPSVAAFTATATPDMQRSIIEKLGLAVDQVISRNPNRPELRFIIYNGRSAGERIQSRRDKFITLTKILRAADRDNEAVIIYCSTVREAERLARRLDTAGFVVRCYHGRLDEAGRTAVQELFMDGDVNIIVATKAFGMGIDKENVRYVIHYQIPGSLEDYYQEAGRAGRDGQTSYAILLYHPSDLRIQHYFIDRAIPEDFMVEAVLDFIRRQAPTQGDLKAITLNPKPLIDLLGEEGERLGLYLHLIESAGFVQRLDDVTVQASTRLLVSAAEISAHLRAHNEPELATQFAALATVANLTERAAHPLDVIEASQQIGLTPQLLDELLYRLAGEEFIIYRPFERGFVLQPQPKLWDGTGFDATTYDAGQIRQEMVQRLAQMRRYAQSLGAGDCYRQAALAYFGATKPTTLKSECCNLCDPNLSVPWQNITPVDFAAVEEVMDVRYILLQSIHWNQSLAEQPHRAPYGPHRLSYVLTGNGHMIGKNETDPVKRARRIAQAESCPYFGALEFIPNKDQGVRAYLDELVDLGLVGYKERLFEDGGSYHYPILLSPGEERLLAGMRFAEEGQ